MDSLNASAVGGSSRLQRMELADALAAQIDAARHRPPLERPLLTWAEGDAIACLLDALAASVAGEPLAELAGELAGRLRFRLGPLPGHDPQRMLAAVLASAEQRITGARPTAGDGPGGSSPSLRAGVQQVV
ncbi:hypothetical protein HS048_35400 [Planomonospora sp. ID91781]|uniref:hypothetical protein n=1 Tax=Planomonospora sp. ID91781 TaxID=2738135 RepID=UPI0018C3B8C2|nr:hypothetical protein [Planomonospora sp. ID91781]MBG0825959.1 hypothetical protein [Planomonospora sp. ID91781]